MMADNVAFFSDVHGNSPALEAVLEDIRRQGCGRVFFLGDIINGLDPHGCVEMLHRWSESTGVELGCIKGNAEAYLATPGRHLLLTDGERWDADLLRLLQWYEDHLSKADLDWVRALPDTLRWNGALLVHDSPLDRAAMLAQADVPPHLRELNFHGRGVTPDMSETEWDRLFGFMETEQVTWLFCGHTHRALLRERGGLSVCNVGSAGMPLDGDPRAAWVKVSVDEAGGWAASIRRVSYDLSRVIRQIEDARDYPDFDDAAFREAYRQMFLHARHWRAFMQADGG